MNFLLGTTDKRLVRFFISLLAVSLFISVFPWIFSFKGKILGVSLSLRALGNGLAGALVLLGIGFLTVPRWRRWGAGLIAGLEALPTRGKRVLLLSFVSFCALGIISHKLRAHYELGTHAFDLGFFSNICWNTAHGDWFFSSMIERNFMAIHVNWILWPLSVFYAGGGGAWILLIAQALFVAMAAPFLGWAVERVTGSFTAGGIAAGLYLCSPYIGHAVLNDFHPDTWQLPCLAAALWAWRCEKRRAVIAFGALALLAKEDVSFVLAGFGIFLTLKPRWRWTGAILIGLAVGALLFHLKLFIPRFVEGSSTMLAGRYYLLGESLEEIIRNIFLSPERLWSALVYRPDKYWRLFSMVFPTGGLALLAPTLLIPPLISVAPHVLSQASTQLQLADIYAIPTQPFVFLAAAFGVKKLMDDPRRRRFLPYVASASLIVGGFGILNTPRAYRFQPPERIAAFQKLQKLVPSDASIAAQQNLYPHFDTRRFAQLFPIGISMPELQSVYLANPDYVAADRIGNALPYTGVELSDRIAAMEVNPSYEAVFEEENFVLFKRTTDEEPRWAN